MSKTWVAWAALALGLMAAGVVLGEPAQVLMKAANVCLACMGVG